MREPNVDPSVLRRGPVAIIANGTAGHGCPPEWARQVEELCAQHGMRAKVQLVQHGEDILRHADDAIARRVSIVVAAGGDGTVSAVASRVAGTGVAMGVLPMGTLNHFAKDMKIPLELPEAVENLAHGRVVNVDIAEVNGRRFINNSSLGLYPDIVRDRERQQRRLGRGKWTALLAASLHAARRYPVLSLRIEVEGETLLRRTAFAFIGNNEYTMEGFNIGERAGLSDGKLSLYVTQRTGRFGLLALALRALAGRLMQAKDFDVITATSFVVESRHSRMRVATDGEVTFMETPLHYRILPGALCVVAPADANSAL